jgi:hypothetical protein
MLLRSSPAAFLTVIFAIAALACFTLQKVNIDKAAQTFDWPKTTAHIIESRVLYPTGFDGKPNRKREYSGKLDFQYQYTVAGQRYTSNRYWVFGMLPMNANLEQIVSEHPVGAETTAYYNPVDASEACIAPGTSSGDPLSVAYWTSGGILLLGFLISLLAAAKESRYRLLFFSR